MRRAAGALSAWALSGGVTAAIVLLCAASAAPAAESAAGSVTRRGIRELLERPAGLRVDGQRLDPRALGRFYRPRDFAPAWDTNDGGLERASLLLQALATADAHGLDPERYHLAAIRARQASADGRRATEIELLLTDAFLRYATDVRAGRRPVGYVQADWGIPASPFDAVSALTQGVRRPVAFAARLASLPPPTKDYARLVEGLRRYRAIAARNGWPPVPPGMLLTYCTGRRLRPRTVWFSSGTMSMDATGASPPCSPRRPALLGRLWPVTSAVVPRRGRRPPR